MRDPVTPDFIIQVTVNGFVKKKCKFTQTMPEGNVQTCLFSEEQRKDIGKRGELAFEPLLMDPTACVVSHP